MSAFKQRSYQPELLDRNDIPFRDIEQNMRELNTINSLLGGHAITLAGLDQLLQKAHMPHRELHILEIGCGGGDNLRVIGSHAQKKKLPVRLTGVDINPECIAFARSLPDNKGIDFICSDYKDVCVQPDIIFSSLFCHHFNEAQLALMLRWMRSQSRTGFFINDLHRHPLAYHSIRLLTRAFSRSYLVKNDAPLSVRRGFVRRDWQKIFEMAGIDPFTCRWKWAFRWLITYRHAAEPRL